MIPAALCTAFSMPLVGKLLGNGMNPKRIIMIGIGITFSFLVLLSFSSPDSNESNFYFPFVLRGVGMAFMMSPILSLAVAGLQGKDMAQAVGLANMIRQLGGAIGIALLNVYLTKQNAVIRGNMIGFVNEANGLSTERVNAFTQNFINAGYPQPDAENLAYKMMEGIVYKQQALVSYDKGFMMVAVCMLICIPIVLLIRHKKGKPMGAVADH